MRLTPCEGCGRHLYAVQTSCPFCGDTRAEPVAGLLPWVIAGLLGTVGCGPAVTGDDGAQVGSSGEVGLQTTTGSTSADPTTAPTPVTTSTSGSSDDATATTESSDGLDDADDNPCGFYAGCAPDGGGDAYECDLIAQDCPEDEKCMPWANDGGNTWNATRCTPVAADVAEVGEPCQVEGNAVSGVDDCALGAVCFGVDPETNIGDCFPLCTGSWREPLCDDGQSCIDVGLAPAPLCFDECNPLAAACTNDYKCVPTQDVFSCAPTAGEGEQGEACLGLNSCAAGNVCINGASVPECEGEQCCTTLCDLAAPTCPTDTSCTAWYEKGRAPEGFENLGVCTGV